ncbi:MAG: Flavodoxin reductase family protein [Candidatus Jorgensenbacteria bacterium GW2011_GWA2_45_13]|uniref:Flavodoxin reductase family protein n=1 Tax=Candidatus Jorgensenbacteria bacterium GW2011_GWA2_45_13 TaxID=1618662 RepID=A0A0G1L9C4_9BACT|nr:MAG: Flavodoxin reductase family protein [Candidatus Jorgensenbacteria bacterium GW2011_GWA2_45_13]
MHTVKFIRAEIVAEKTMRFFFEKPEGFNYVSGQYAEFAFINPSETDNEGMSRCLSFTSVSSDKELSITTRIRDTAFKRMLVLMKKGKTMNMDGPFGSLTLHKNEKKPAVFVTGGIGITPFVSIVREATEKKLSHALTLFYSNRRLQDAPFLKVRKYCNNLALPVWYIAGPSKMVLAMRNMLVAIGADEDNIRTEEFPRY